MNIFSCVAIVFPARGLNSWIIFTILIPLKLNNKEKSAYLLYGSTSNPNTLNKVVINTVIKFIKATDRFEKPRYLTNEKSSFIDFHFILN